MALETGTYISDLVSSNPAGTDTLDKADDHLRLIKSTVKATFPNIAGAVTPTHTDLNKLTSSGSPQFATIELGAASDTTISRSAAGVIAVEGGVVPLENRTNTFSVKQQILTATPETLTVSSSTANGGYIEIFTDNGTTKSYVGSHKGVYGVGLTTDLTVYSPNNLTLGTAFAERMRIDNSGNVGIGETSTGSKLHVGAAGNTTARILSSNGQSPELSLFSTGLRDWRVLGGDAWRVVQDSTERLRVDASGNILNTSSGGLGYGTGSGGTVTQVTSRTTGVIINKTNGAITLVSAAGTTTWQSFTVTNSTVAVTDTVIVSQKSGTDLNEIHVTAVAAGSFSISFATTGGTTTEQPVFNFAVIKAVTS